MMMMMMMMMQAQCGVAVFDRQMTVGCRGRTNRQHIRMAAINWRLVCRILLRIGVQLDVGNAILADNVYCFDF